MTNIEVPEQKHESQSVPVLAVLWQSRMKMLFAVEKPLTPKEFGQLAMLRKHLSDLTSDVLDWALNNWRLFCHEVRVLAGLSCAPAAPHIGFLLTYYPAAVDLMYALAKNRTVKSAADISLINKIDKHIAKQKQEIEKELSAMSEQ